MSEEKKDVETFKLQSLDLAGAGRSDTISTNSSVTTSILPQIPRRFSSNATYSFDVNDFYSTSINQRVYPAMSLHGKGYRRGHSHRTSMNSSISNFSTMSETSLPWTTKDIGFNAISGVLNNPNAKVSNKTKPLKNDIPSVPHTTIRKVKPTDFKSYIRQISPVFERYIHNKDNQKPLATSILEANLGNLQISYDDNEIPAHRLESTRNPYTIPMLPQPLEETQSLKPDVELPLLEVVPSIFFDPDFNLESPKTFDVVCEKTEDIENNIDSLSISTNAIIQEKLYIYLDKVEIHLVNEISLRSSSFFTALSNLRMLHSETLECISQINNLRKKLARIENSQVKRGLEVVRLKRRRENIVKLYKGIKMIAEIRSIQPLIQMLLEQGDYFSVMDFIEKVNTILRCDKSQQDQLINAINYNSIKVQASTKNDPRVIIMHRLNNIAEEIKSSGFFNLEKVKALTYFSEQLNEMHKMIGAVMENDFLNIIFSDFNEHIKNVKAIDAVNILCNNSNHLAKDSAIGIISDDSVTEKEEKLKNRIETLILGLYEVNRFEPAFQAYHERMMEEIKCIIQIQKYFQSSIPLGDTSEDQTGDTSVEYSSQITNLIKETSSNAFLDILSYIYVVLLESIKKIVTYDELFSTILTNIQTTDLEIHSDKNLLVSEKDLSNSDLQVDYNGNSKESIEAEIPIIETQNERIESGNFKFSNALKFTTGIKSIIKKTTLFKTKSQASISAIAPKVSESTSPDSQTNETLGDDNSDNNNDDSIDNNNDNSNDNNNYAKIASDSSQIIFVVTDLAHVWCANLVSIRADQNAHMIQKDFYRLFNVTWAFVLECENLCGRTCYGLRGTITSQAKAFLNNFHTEKIQQEAASVENEQWAQAEVPVYFQQVVNQIIAAAVKGLSDFKCNQFDCKNENEQITLNNSDTKRNNICKYIFVEERRFYIVSCGLILLKILVDYLSCMANIPVLAVETMNKIIEMLNLFNSRTCQVILGGGARHSAGLKIITAKHLALASQSLGAIIALIPFIRECIRNNLSDKQMIMLTEFDRIKRDYINHQNEVHAKLVSIMDTRLLVHLKSFGSIMWDESSKKNGPNSYMELLVKEIIKLHNVLTKILPQETLQKVMSDVFKSSNAKLAKEIAKVDIYTPAGKERVIQDVRFYIRKLSALNLQELANELETVVNNLPIKEKEKKSDETVDLTSSSND
ncbi:4017_t:CDS:10 [Dentiscutata erythropus]|uniref:Vacuolar protein sorting-associated protein 54 n=1 Tax=Dentiscutata erythropus TaxID=1348616 RepID=A0A9N9A044_9GLOM|nr:4017_t:CDS:10 [Dentiscutata erythropus]